MDLRKAIGLGVAGNFTGHLEQAGEASDFVDVQVQDAKAPKGIFPFYVPGAEPHFVGDYPISSESIVFPADAEKLQIEPEVSLYCDLVYAEDGRVAEVIPRRFGAHNDCSIRREGARKISEKKNWGACSKGVAPHFIAIDRFEPGGVLDHYRLASYLERGGALHPYGVDSAVTGYSYFHQQLLDWLVDRMNAQEDGGPLESIAHWLAVAKRPAHALISIGATRYTEFGETHFLEPGDHSIVVVYDSREYDEAAIRALVVRADATAAPGISLLRQRVERA